MKISVYKILARFAIFSLNAEKTVAFLGCRTYSLTVHNRNCCWQILLVSCNNFPNISCGPSIWVCIAYMSTTKNKIQLAWKLDALRIRFLFTIDATGTE